jgi:hypothetical protein
MTVEDTTSTAGEGARSLKTAAAVLRALRLLGTHPAGLTPQELGRCLGKSSATARYMINTLCAAGFADRDEAGRARLLPTPPWGAWSGGSDESDAGSPDDAARPADPAEGSGALAGALTELCHRTRQRAYLVAPPHDPATDAAARVLDARGHQGMAHPPGLGPGPGTVPAFLVGAWGPTRALLATSPAWTGALGDAAPAPAILADVLARGWAADEEQLAAGFCSIGAVVPSPDGLGPPVALGIATSARRFALECETLVEAVLTVAARARRAWADEFAGGGPQRPTSVSPKALSRR